MKMSQLSMGIKVHEPSTGIAPESKEEKKSIDAKPEEEEVLDTPKGGLRDKINRMKSKENDDEELMFIAPT